MPENQRKLKKEKAKQALEMMDLAFLDMFSDKDKRNEHLGKTGNAISWVSICSEPSLNSTILPG